MSSSPTDTRAMVEVVMPQMGVSVAEGTVAGWLKQPGDPVTADDPICEVTTDKIDIEIPSPGAGELVEILVDEGETVPVGTLLGRIAPAGAAAAGEAPSEPVAEQIAAAPTEHDRSGFYSPVVRRIAEKHGVDLAGVPGRGIGGRVRKVDLLAFIEDGAANGGAKHDRPLHSESPYVEDVSAQARPASIDELVGPVRREALDPMRKAIASHMVASRRTAAHCTTVVEADFGPVLAARSRLREPMERRGVRLTPLAFVARAAVEGLAEHPRLNASIEGEEIVYHDDVNLGIAVALDGGLIVPVIRRAQHLSLEGLAAAIADAGERARAGRLEPDELAGGTFTITNPGRFGAVIATPIINQPQVAILDLEAITRRPVVVEAADGTESIGIRPLSYLCMSWDHRALDGADAARFLATVRGRLESVEVAS